MKSLTSPLLLPSLWVPYTIFFSSPGPRLSLNRHTSTRRRPNKDASSRMSSTQGANTDSWGTDRCEAEQWDGGKLCNTLFYSHILFFLCVWAQTQCPNLFFLLFIFYYYKKTEGLREKVTLSNWSTTTNTTVGYNDMHFQVHTMWIATAQRKHSQRTTETIISRRDVSSWRRSRSW